MLSVEMDFYDQIAGEYDRITDTAARAAAAEGFVAELADRFAPASALDVACGTGVYTLPLARRGVRTVGVDLSEPMLAQARRRAAREPLSIEWLCAPMQELAGRFDRTFDAVLCMGNSIPHLLTDADLDAALGGLVGLLTPGGVLVLQLLNYARVLARRERIIGIDRSGDRQYVRFYDFLPDRVRFNILEIAWQGDRWRHALHSTELRPYTARTLQDAVIRHGCGDVERYSGLRFEPFDEDASDTVMLVGRYRR